jgi:hypothetical protein
MSLSFARSSLFYVRTLVERRGGSILFAVRLRDRSNRELAEADVGPMGVAGRDRASHPELATVDQRAGSFQPIQFIPPADDSIVSRSAVLSAFALSGRQLFALGLGDTAELFSAHRLVHLPRSAAK